MAAVAVDPGPSFAPAGCGDASCSGYICRLALRAYQASPGVRGRAASFCIMKGQNGHLEQVDRELADTANSPLHLPRPMPAGQDRHK